MKTISTEILGKGILAEDLKLIRAWGYFLGLDDKTIKDSENNSFYAEQIKFLKEYEPNTNNNRDKLSTSQLRKFFGAVKKIQSTEFEKSKSEIELLIPKIAYSVGRDIKKDNNQLKYKSKIKDFYDLLLPLLNEIKQDKNRFKNFVNILESLVAYHKEVSVENN